MEVHFIDVGQGNMVLIKIPNSKIIVKDCNITDENEERILNYVESEIGISSIDIFINSHRDGDHSRGLKKLYDKFGIKEIWDSGVAGTTVESSTYRQYMNLKRQIGKEISPKKYWTFGECKLRVMNGKNSEFDDSNDQSLVVKLEYKGSGIMLPGDSSYKSWKDFIIPNYSDSSLKSTILLASHHGSISFFDDPEDKQYYYTSHIRKIAPKLTIISVGDNNTHPNPEALKMYKKYSTGYGDKKVKLLTTNDNKTIKFEFGINGSSKYKCNL